MCFYLKVCQRNMENALRREERLKSATITTRKFGVDVSTISITLSSNVGVLPVVVVVEEACSISGRIQSIVDWHAR